MATAHSSRSARPRGRASGNEPRTHPKKVEKKERPAAGSAETLVRREFRRLHKALTIVHCLEMAVEHGADVDVCDVAAVVADLIDKSLYEFIVAGLGDDSPEGESE